MATALNASGVEKLKGIFRDLFNDDDLEISRDTTAADVPGWDSFNHINLIMMVENEFRIRMKTAEITHLKNVGELMDLIAAKTA